MSIFKGKKLYSILAMKCAKCHEGDLFKDPNPYHFRNLFKMPDICPVCGQKYQPEPGFWFGSMYVSYALNVAIWVTLFVAIYSFVKLYWVYFLLIGAAVDIGLVPVIFRLSRSIWMNFFVSYDPLAAKGE